MDTEKTTLEQFKKWANENGMKFEGEDEWIIRKKIPEEFGHLFQTKERIIKKIIKGEDIDKEKIGSEYTEFHKKIFGNAPELGITEDGEVLFACPEVSDIKQQ